MEDVELIVAEALASAKIVDRGPGRPYPRATCIVGGESVYFLGPGASSLGILGYWNLAEDGFNPSWRECKTLESAIRKYVEGKYG